MQRFDWSQWVGDMISPADEVLEARAAGRTLAEQAELLTHLLAELWASEGEEIPDTLRDDILAELEAAAKEIDDSDDDGRGDMSPLETTITYGGRRFRLAAYPEGDTWHAAVTEHLPDGTACTWQTEQPQPSPAAALTHASALVLAMLLGDDAADPADATSPASR